MKFIKCIFSFALCCIFVGIISVGGLYYVMQSQLPDVTVLERIQLQTPLRIYSFDGQQIAQFGEKQRIPVLLEQMPPQLVQAFLAIEDSRFYSHYGVDPVGILRAIWVGATSDRIKQGASTITQQLARNFFLSSERRLMRKIKEIMLAIRIERYFSKDKIFELYLNKIYFGQHAYGVGAAAQIYFGKPVEQLDLSEMALLAGIPKAPSTLNPIHSIDRATARRNLVLSRMLEKGYINSEEYYTATQSTVISHYHHVHNSVDAPHLADMVRQEMVQRFGEAAYTDGYQVYTTVTHRLQESAQQALRNNLLNYDRRHGYRGPSAHLWSPHEQPWNRAQIQSQLKTQPAYGPLQAAVIISIQSQTAKAILADGSEVTLPWSGIKWARPFIDDQQQGPLPETVSDVLNPGEQVWLTKIDQNWWLAQIPEANSALVAIDPQDGAIKALVGGVNFNDSAFNRVTQSIRMAGSSIKPFIYAAALEKGLTLATLLNDLPITRWDAGAGKYWRPKNVVPVYDGPLRLRVGLARSKNMMAVRALRAIGVGFAAEYLERFGFSTASIVRAESLALGAATVNPLQMVRGYAVFANGGYLVDPFFIDKIIDAQGNTVYKANPKRVCQECRLPVVYKQPSKATGFWDQHNELSVQAGANENSGIVPLPTIEWLTAPQVEQQHRHAPHVISEQIAFLIRDALISAIWGESKGGWLGTGWRAMHVLKRHDIAGKSGTTNNVKDAWYSGFGPGIVATVWIGFDDYQRDLGQTTAHTQLKDIQAGGGEGGAKSAQPAWNNFMKNALSNTPETVLEVPENIVSVRIDLKSGMLSDDVESDSRMEYFITGSEPTQKAAPEVGLSLFE